MTETQQFEAFMQNYQNMVFSTALRLVANEAEAQDISQEVFLRAFQHFSELNGQPRAAGWLKTVAINLSLNHLTRYRARWTFFTDLFRRDAAGDEPELDFPAPDCTPDSVGALERHRLLENALRQLPEGQRVPLVLFHVEGLKYEEIAARLRVSLGKVKTDIFRARQALRQKLEPYFADER